MEILAIRVGQFLGEGYRWALSLPLPELLRLGRLMADMAERESNR